LDASELRAKKDEAHQEWLGLQDEFRAEREEMLEELRDLEKHLKLDDTIIQHFVPAEAVEMIQKRATWDEQLDNWVLAPLSATDHDGEPILEPRPRCAVGDGPRPLCDYARIAAASAEYNNPRFKHDNILSLELDPPERTTQDYDMPPEGMGGGMGGMMDPDMMSPDEYAMAMAGGGMGGMGGMGGYDDIPGAVPLQRLHSSFVLTLLPRTQGVVGMTRRRKCA